MNDSTTIKIIDLKFDYSEPTVILSSDWLFLISIIVFFILVHFIFKLLKNKKFPLVEMDIEISGSPKVKFKVKRDDSNIYIANRIFIELVTRKAALAIDEEQDVIVEVYDSWYKLFGIIRDEIKNVPGHYLQSHYPTTELLGLTTKILNEGLRPHLTKYQAKFRKWYTKELENESNKNLNPQEIQQNYESYSELIKDMKMVNLTIINYSEQLDKLIKG